MTLTELATLSSGLATTLTAVFLWQQLKTQNEEWQQNKLFNRIAVIFHQDFWHKKHLTQVELINTCNSTIVIHHFYLRNKSIKETRSIGGSNLIDDLMENTLITLKPGENLIKEIKIEELPLHVPIFVEIRYKSSIDNFSRLIFFEDKETRVIN